MTRRQWLTVATLGIGLGLAGSTTAIAHEGIRAVLTFDPARPVVGETCTVQLRLQTVAGGPPAEDFRLVQFSADMSGHAMRPVESTLGATSEPGVFRGTLTFTMAGPWNAAVKAENGHETLTGTTPVEVLMEAEPTSPGATPRPTSGTVVTMTVAEAESPIDPWSVLLAALGLTAVLEIVAIGRKMLTDPDADERRAASGAAARDAGQ